MNAIIIGINGQDGFYLNKLLSAKQINVIGIARSKGDWIQGDVTDFPFISELIKKHQPQYIFHLAANSSTRHDLIFENHETIATGTINVLESAYRFSKNSKIFICGSGVHFKNNGFPVSETDEFFANSPYAVSRISSVYAARYYREIGLKTYVGYLFHHESPLRKKTHISKMTTDFIKSLNAESKTKLKIFDPTVKKEWAFAQDIAEGMFALISQNETFEACIGTGESYSIEEWLKTCFAIKGLNYIDHVDFEKTEFKPEYNILVSNPLTMNKIGWKFKTTFHELAKIMME
ncbi:MAG: GDP-mannose 4,6-dehydratase [Bacteroidia bacterium]|nr:GDP-mannose 4,6-dehydratase [Bacteroidia bacterium]